jgi:hypothetical protein
VSTVLACEDLHRSSEMQCGFNLETIGNLWVFYTELKWQRNERNLLGQASEKCRYPPLDWIRDDTVLLFCFVDVSASTTSACYKYLNGTRFVAVNHIHVYKLVSFINWLV